MKKIFFAVLVLLAVVGCSPKPAVFTGKITGLKPESNVFLLDISRPNDMTPIKVMEDGSYRLEIKDGPCARYIMVDDPKGGVKFYAEPGMTANIDLEFKMAGSEGGEEFYETLDTYTGDNKDAYDFLSEGEYYNTVQNPVIMAHYDAKDLTFDQFRKEMQDAVDVNVVKMQKVQSPVFKEWMKKDYETKMKTSYGWFPVLAREADPSFKAYLDGLDRNANLQDAQAFMSGYSAFYLPKDKDANVAWFEELNKQFTNKDIIRNLADQHIADVLRDAPANIADIFAAYQTVEPGRTVPQEIQDTYDHYKNLVPGALAADFDFYDVDGNKYMLSELRGKALYIDCWATWCGPCRAETPNMVELYNHYKNDPRIQLVSISLDKKEKNWKAVVAEEKLAWPQYIVHDEFESALCKNYDISGIPRFLFFDKEGRILSLDAKRPSDPEIIDWIESLLK